ncbi:MAG: tRNA (cytidine(34)-2'-O)-methyltransferase [Burkholderiales bacterium]
MFNIVLFEPEIPPNTGNIIRLCATNMGATLHLVKPLGFFLDDKLMRRAGLDYHALAEVRLHNDWQACLAALSGKRMFAVTTRGGTRYDLPRYEREDVFVFGPETRGLPIEILEAFAPETRIQLPMREGSRSLNLANAVAVIVYEAWRQLKFG